MDATEQVILIVKLALYIAPPALYFVILGLVNSQGRAHVVSGRRDWLSLMMVFFPILVWPTAYLVEAGRWNLFAMVTLGWVLFLWLSTPDELASLVGYNTTENRCRRALEAVLDSLGIPFRGQDRAILLPDHDIRITFNSMAVLRNVTVHFDGPLHRHEGLLRELRGRLAARLWQAQCTPALGAACLLIAGTVMLMLPLFMMIRHIDALVKVVGDLLPV